MPPKKGKPRTTREQRAAAVRRVIAGAHPEVIAAELGVQVARVHDWEKDWRSRVGAWCDIPLEPIEAKLGFTLAPRYAYGDSGPVLGLRVVVPDDVESEGKRCVALFLERLGRLPTSDGAGTAIADAFKQLDEASQARLAPAFDTYQHAIQHAAELRRLSAMAMELAVRELGEEAPSAIGQEAA